MTRAITTQDTLNEIETNLKTSIKENARIANRYRLMIIGMSAFLLMLTAASFGLSINNLVSSAELAFPSTEKVLDYISRSGRHIHAIVSIVSPTVEKTLALSLPLTLIIGCGAYVAAFVSSLLSSRKHVDPDMDDKKNPAPLDHTDILAYIDHLKEIEKLKSGGLSQDKAAPRLEALEKKYRPLEAPKQNLLFLLAPIGVHLAVVLTSILISTLLFSNPVTSPIMIAMIVLSGTYLAVSAAKAYATKKEHDAFLQSFRDLAAEFGFDREGKQPIQEIVSALNQEIITAVNPVEEPLDSLVSEIKAQGLTFSDQHIKTDTDQIGTNGSLKKKDGFDARPVNHLVL